MTLPSLPSLRSLGCGALLLLAAGGASAHGGGFWFAAAIGYCMAQDAGYAQLPTGRKWAQEESITRFIRELKPELKACLVSRKALSANLCKALLAPEPDPDQSDEELERIADKYKKELELLLEPNCAANK